MLAIVACAVLGFLALPIALIALWSFSAGAGFAIPPESLSLKWYANLLGQSGFAAGLGVSTALAAASSLIGLPVALAAALAIVRWRFPGRDLINALALTPLIVPEVVMGLALLIWLDAVRVDPGGIGLYLLHLLIVLPYMLRILIANLARADPHLEQAAMLLGASPARAVLLVTLPGIGKGVAAALLVAFVISFHNFTASYFLVAGHPTLPVAMFQYIRTETDPTIAALSTLLTAAAAALVWAADRWLGDRRGLALGQPLATGPPADFAGRAAGDRLSRP